MDTARSNQSGSLFWLTEGFCSNKSKYPRQFQQNQILYSDASRWWGSSEWNRVFMSEPWRICKHFPGNAADLRRLSFCKYANGSLKYKVNSLGVLLHYKVKPCLNLLLSVHSSQKRIQFLYLDNWMHWTTSLIIPLSAGQIKTAAKRKQIKRKCPNQREIFIGPSYDVVVC